jgi:hypothetical protein
MAARIVRAAGCVTVCGGDTNDVAVSESGETGETREGGGPAIVEGEERA